jgi:hypothetical protein
MRRRTIKERASLPQPKIVMNESKVQQCADLISELSGDPEAMRQLWDAIDEPARETMLSYFADWDQDFADALNPAL